MVRGLVGLVIASVLMLAVVGVVTLGPSAFEPYLPRAVTKVLADFGAGTTVVSGGPTSPQGTGDLASDYLFDDRDGLVARGPIAARLGNEAVFRDDVITGYETAIADDLPAEIMTIRPILGCDFTPPVQGSVVGHATAGRSGLDLALSTYDDTDLAAAVQAFVNVYRETGTIPKASSDAQAYAAYDVAVTEARAPVYLVLEARFGNQIWNIHTAPGVRIERVVLLGGDQAGVANLDPLVPVEVMLNDGMAACGIAPAYPLNPGHLLYQSLAAGVIAQDEADATLAIRRAAVAAYDGWFADRFGVTAGTSRIGWDEGTLSVIGPVPGAADPKAVWAPITGAKIRTTQDTFFEIRGQIKDGIDFSARVLAIATTFASGDLTSLLQGVAF